MILAERPTGRACPFAEMEIEFGCMISHLRVPVRLGRAVWHFCWIDISVDSLGVRSFMIVTH